MIIIDSTNKKQQQQQHRMKVNKRKETGEINLINVRHIKWILICVCHSFTHSFMHFQFFFRSCFFN